MVSKKSIEPWYCFAASLSSKQTNFLFLARSPVAAGGGPLVLILWLFAPLSSEEIRPSREVFFFPQLQLVDTGQFWSAAVLSLKQSQHIWTEHMLSADKTNFQNVLFCLEGYICLWIFNTQIHFCGGCFVSTLSIKTVFFVLQKIWEHLKPLSLM